jgi:lysophospholipase L1-like esterase
MNKLWLSVFLNVVLGAALALGLGYALYRRSLPPDSFWAARHLEARTDLFARLSTAPRGIVLVGDSMIERGEWRELLRRNDVYNRGIGGDTTIGVRRRLAQVIEAEPSVVVLMIGINDLEAGRLASDVATDIDGIVVELSKQLPSAKLVLLSVLPMRDVGRGIGVSIERVGDLDERLAALAKERGITFVDLRDGLVDPASGQLAEAVTLDGVHLNGAGYLIWASALTAHLP